MADTRSVQVQAETQGAVPEAAVSYAADQVSALLRKAPEPVLFARVSLIMAADPAVERPALALLNIDLNGRLIRAQAAGENMREATHHACDRLRIRIQRAARNWAAVRGSQPEPGPGEWRHQSHPAAQPPYFPRPPEERTVVRHTSYVSGHQTPDEAVADAELLDYDFHLFTEKSTGEDSVIYRSGGGFRLALAHPRARRWARPVPPSASAASRCRGCPRRRRSPGSTSPGRPSCSSSMPEPAAAISSTTGTTATTA